MSLLDLVDLPSGQVSPLASPFSRYPLIAPDHVEGMTGRLLPHGTAAEQGAISGKYLVAAGDIVYSKIRPNLQKAAIALGPALCSADMYPLRPRPGIPPALVLGIVLSGDFTRFATAASTRSGIPKINRADLARYRLRLPKDPAELVRIGEALAAVDERRELARTRLERAAILLRETEIDIARRGRTSTLGASANITMGQSPPSALVTQEARIGTPFLQGSAEFGSRFPAAKNWISSAGHKRAALGAVLVSVRAPVGTANLADQEFVIGRGLAAVDFESRVHPLTALALFREAAHRLQRRAQGSTFDAIDGAALSNLTVRLPPADEARRIEDLLRAGWDQHDALAATCRRLDDLAVALRAKLLVGKASG